VPPFPYIEEEVSFDNKAAEIKLAGTLTIPRGKGPFPAVVLIPRLGPFDRDERQSNLRTFFILSDYLTRAGIAVLRTDVRGIGKSGGKYGGAQPEDYVSDAEAALVEIRRVLRPGGALAVFWARTDRHADGLHLGIGEIDEVVERERASSPILDAYRSWFEPPERIEGFTPLERRSFATTRTISSARLADLYATSSDIASLPEPRRGRLLERIGELAADLPETLELAERSEVQLWFREVSGA